MKKILTGIFLLILTLGGVSAGIKLPHSLNPKNIPQESSVRTNVAKPIIKISEIGTPKILRIPKIKVDANIESLGLDKEKAMDVPKDSDNAGWFNLGVKPGEKGNGVLDGHLDKASGAPAVFWNLAKLVAGDKIIVTDEKGTDRTFSVVRIAQYPYDNFPLQEVFGPSDKAMLNLISCNGTWNSLTHNYSKRTVVYSQLSE